MATINVTHDASFRDLTTNVIRSSCDTANIDVVGVDFGVCDPSAAYSWLCFVVDPSTDDHVAGTTGSSGADHLAIIDPGGIVREAGSRIAVTVFDIVVADEAAMTVRGDAGQPVLISPWVHNLALARATFNYRLVDVG